MRRRSSQIGRILVYDSRTFTSTTETPDLRAIVEAIERFLARTPSRIMLANIDDAVLEADQLNMPGTVFEVPNWRRKLSMSVERFATDSFVERLAKAIAAERENANQI